jgi:hypothetical protein
MVFTKFTHKGFFQADNTSSNECHGNYVKAIQKWNLPQMPNGITKFTHKEFFQANNSSSNECHVNYVKIVFSLFLRYSIF